MITKATTERNIRLIVETIIASYTGGRTLHITLYITLKARRRTMVSVY